MRHPIDRTSGDDPSARRENCARHRRHVRTRVGDHLRNQSSGRRRRCQRAWNAARHEDLLGDTVAASCESGFALRDVELSSIVQQRVVAGSEAMFQFVRHPDQYARFWADPVLSPNAIEEVVRSASPSSGGGRKVTCDTELGGVTVPAGARLMLRFATANRDVARYAQLDMFHIGRSSDRTQQAFGRGIHICIGNLLARREVAVVLQELTKRLTAISPLCTEAELVYPPNILLRGLTALPLQLER